MTNVDFFKREFPKLGDQFDEILQSGFLTTGNISRHAETLITDFLEVDNCLVVNSWTNGAIIALKALGLGIGDDVLVPAMTFCATANVVHAIGANPILVDVDRKDGNVTLDNIKDRITPETKAVFVVHMYGKMLNIIEIAEYCNKRGIYLLEDAAHAFESTYKGIHPGQLSTLAIFSFYATKNITCGEGGAIVTNNGELADKLRELSLHGMTKGAQDRYKNKYYQHYDVLSPGYKANLPDILSFMLIYQLKDIEKIRAPRSELALRYESFFRENKIDEILFDSTLPNNSHHARHLFPIKIMNQDRDQFAKRLNDAGISVAVNFRSLTQLSAYSENRAPEAEFLGANCLSLPFYPNMSEETQTYLLEQVTQLYQK